MKRKRKVLADNRGSTLVESVCGLVILALVLVTMYSAFVVAQKILREGDIREKNGQAAFEAIEKQDGNPRPVYDHEERAWYYRLVGRDKSDIVNMTWPALKAMIHNEAEWRGLL